MYQNPIPVVVTIVPVIDGKRVGVVLIRRNQEPGKGQLALPGGYLELEDWAEGAARELKEETGIVVAPATIVVYHVASTPDRSKLILFTMTPPQPRGELPQFTPGDEIADRIITLEPVELAFDTHTQALASYFGEIATPQLI